MGFSGKDRPWLIVCSYILQLALVTVSTAEDIFLEWHVANDTAIGPAYDVRQPIISINGMFPGPLIDCTTNDVIHINVFNNIDEPLLFTWNGIQQRLNSWQDGVSGTNCPIQPGKNWTYVFQTKDQIGSFFYFPSLNFQKAAGGYGRIRVNNRDVIPVPFPPPEADIDLLIGDWYLTSYKEVRSTMTNGLGSNQSPPDMMLMNGLGSYFDPKAIGVGTEGFYVTKGKTYRLRISNVGIALSFNFMIQNHSMVLVETEGSYTNQIRLDSLDVHVGQSYSVLFTADQDSAAYYIVATPKMTHASVNSSLVGVGVIVYDDASSGPSETLPSGPDPFDLQFSINQAKSIRWNLTAGAARPNPQGTFNVTNATLSQTFILRGSTSEINGAPHYTVNNVAYLTPETPLKLAEHFANGSGVYELDKFPVNTSNIDPVLGVFVATGIHRGWTEIVFKNELEVIDSWHLDGFGFFVVGYGDGEWRPELRSTYNLYDPVVRSTVQVYPGGWTAVYAYLDNPGMWNLRSQLLKNWYLGQELYLRVYDADSDPAKERPPPENLLLCGKYGPPAGPSPVPSPKATNTSSAPSQQLSRFHIFALYTVTVMFVQSQWL